MCHAHRADGCFHLATERVAVTEGQRTRKRADIAVEDCRRHGFVACCRPGAGGDLGGAVEEERGGCDEAEAGGSGDGYWGRRNVRPTCASAFVCGGPGAEGPSAEGVCSGIAREREALSPRGGCGARGGALCAVGLRLTTPPAPWARARRLGSGAWSRWRALSPRSGRRRVVRCL